MQRIPNVTQLADLDADALARSYAYPRHLERPWVRANFVSSIDGALAVDGVTKGLATPADKLVFKLLRELADVILVGAGTVRTENYGGARTDDEHRRAHFRHGVGGSEDGSPPPIAVVSGSANLDPAARLFTDARTPPLILTTAQADKDRVTALEDAGAEVVVAAEFAITPAALLRVLTERGLPRVLCEGGPHLFGQLAEADLVDELCLTTAPLLVGGAGGRISLSAKQFGTSMARKQLVLDDDGTVLARWARR
ncbi:pyrimidine reductase family protein [Nocardia ignorata]|uniref:5-amino-6-(5-phosphoribosylamino)uracil reductase n=1 Tax=Nocardia ignorata TaxID=145285 RepID=A0A4V3CQA3_NOCIG|nr:pyrimidine reductase family protein [Nocardia ignorata]TDP41469.1 5-amino-6-(5-phosphoribosylamino)uracil reductase [Nocardia ignorata]